MKYSRIIVALTLLMAVFTTAALAEELVRREAPSGAPVKMAVKRAAAPQETRMPGRTDIIPPQLFGQNGPWVAPRNEGNPLDLEAVVWVDDSWNNQGDVDLFNPALIWNTNAFKTIQAGIDAAASLGVVNVRYGSYNETATGRMVLGVSGPYQFGLFIADSKDGITIRAYDASDVLITNYVNALTVLTNATNNFGYSGTFIEADDVTITGLNFGQNAAGTNKTIEVIGDGLTIRDCQLTDGAGVGGGSLYFGDWRFDTMNDISWIQSYTIDECFFRYGNSIDFASGAGYSGPVSGRQITDNTFDNSYVGDNWPLISFNGSNTGVPWFVQSVGAAVIMNNSFSNGDGLYIRHRGDFVDYNDFDWPTYWSGNTFDKKVIFGSNPPTSQGSYTYTSGSYTFNNVKEIGASIQREIDRASSGHTVLCGAGTYVEAPVITKNLTLKGAGQGVTIIDANASAYVGIHADGNYNITLEDFSLDGPTGANGFGIMSAGENQNIAIHNVTVFSCQRTAITLNGVASGDLQNITCTGTIFGVGLATTDCDNVTINGLNTSGNAWAGSAVYTGGGYFAPGSNNITYMGTLSFGEATPIYTERDNTPGFRPAINNLVVPTSLQYLSSSNAVYWVTAYYPNQAGGVAAAVGMGTTGWTFDRVNNYFYVTPPMLIQAAIDAAAPNDDIICSAGTFAEDVNVNELVTITGAGIDMSYIQGLKTGPNGSTVRMSTPGAVIEGFTITRDGNNVTDWATNVKSAGLSVQTTGGAIVRNNKFTGNRTAIDINNSNDNQILNNVIDFNRTGMIFRNACLNNLVEENYITNNWTIGVLWLNAGTETATGTEFFNNSISDNWYGDVENRSLTGGVKNFSVNWYGTNNPTTSLTPGGEPAYVAQIPVAYGGAAVDPGTGINIRGAGLADIDYSPYFETGTDTNVETAFGRGTIGFQGNFSQLHANANSAITGTVNILQEAVNLVSGSTIYLSAGNYVGQVKATGFANLNIIGAGAATTFIKATAATMPDTFGTVPYHNRPILWLEGCTTANLSNLTIDGDGYGNMNYRMIGVAFRNSGGSMTNVNVTEIRETPFNGNQHGVGVWVGHNTTGRTVNLTNVNITDFMKNGTNFSGVGTVVNCDNVNVVGHGATGITAQNGFQYAYGASGSIQNSSVTGICYTGPTYVACGNLLYDAGITNFVNSDATNCQVGSYFIDAGGSVNGGLFTANPALTTVEKYGITSYNTSAALSAPRNVPQLYADEAMAGERDRALDDNEVLNINGASIIGDGSAGGFGFQAYVSSGDLDFSLTNSNVENWNYGVDLTVAGGTISDADVTNNTFTNTVNTFDNTSGHNWDSNCYSDFVSNPYTIPGATPVNLDNNANPGGCANDVGFTFEDPSVGCAGSGCDATLLYLTLNNPGIPNLSVVFQVPAGFTALLAPMGSIVTPLVNADPNIIQAYAIPLGGGLVQVDIGFESPYSVGNPTLYIACIPILNQSATTGLYPINGVSTLWTDMLGNDYYNALVFGSINIEVDCTIPVISSFTNAATCAFGDASQLVNQFSVSLTDAGSTLDSAWITFAPGGGSFPLFGANQTAPYNATLPSAGDAAMFYGYLVEGCNTLTLHLTDTECNTATTVALANVGRDNSAPSLSVATSIPANYCFNNNPLTVNYGGAYLDNYIDITSSLGANACMAATGTLIVSYGALADFTVALNQTGYPTNDAEALALWNWMLGDAGIAAANGASFIFNVKAVDCAGNMTGTQTFTICVDTQTPGNAVTVFDARPAHLGVWLKWQWTASGDAQEMRIYRSPLSAQYPGYPGDLWNSLVNYDVTAVPPSGWTLVATQTALTGTVTSASYAGLNNRGDALTTHVDGGATYWLDAQGGWVEGNGNAPAFRDIYRYVTFVKDAGGNWSVGAPVVMTTNADRSTNYWLGDFSTADAAGMTGSRGYVDTEDLGLLSPVYFTNTGGYRNIGPVVVENGNIGKGIPNPEGSGAINFSDLVPFSFNFGMVSPIGYPTEFVVQPDVTQYRPFGQLDVAPQVTMATAEDVTYNVGTEFTVTLALNGNEGRVVKAVEAILSYDESRLEYVSSSVVTEALTEGTLFSKSALVNNEAGSVGFVAAACGGISTLDENVILGTVTFRVTREMDRPCEIALSEVRMVDNTGEVRDTEGEVISVTSGSAIPDNYALYQNYPNPFNPTTNIRFDVKEAGRVTVLVYNTLGQLVATPINADMPAGRHEVTFDATNLTSGLYIYSISVNGFNDLKKMVLIR